MLWMELADQKFDRVLDMCLAWFSVEFFGFRHIGVFLISCCGSNMGLFHKGLRAQQARLVRTSVLAMLRSDLYFFFVDVFIDVHIWSGDL